MKSKQREDTREEYVTSERRREIEQEGARAANDNRHSTKP